MKHQIETSNELIEKGTIISSPANRNIVYKLETAFDIIVAYWAKALEQASEILNNLKHGQLQQLGFHQQWNEVAIDTLT